MHGALDCPSGLGSSTNIKAGDTWLSTELPRIIAYAQAHDGVVFLTWDEGDATNLIPFIAIGTHVKPGMTATMYTHSSMIKTVEEIFGLPVLPKVASSADFADMFVAGTLN
jgi:acid phosphatase